MLIFSTRSCNESGCLCVLISIETGGMNRRLFLFLNLTALLLMVGFTGCDDDDDTARQVIVGKWVNVTGDEGHVPVDTDFSMEFLSDGTVLYHDDLMTLTARPSKYEIAGKFLYLYYANGAGADEPADVFIFHFSDDFNRLELKNVLSSMLEPMVFKRLK